ncbi:MAG: threonine synthase [Thermoproteota archaeon]
MCCDEYAPNRLVCTKCGKEFNLLEKRIVCDCGGLLEIRLNKSASKLSWNSFRKRKFNLWRYRDLIPLPKDTTIITMGEGGTPLISSFSISKELGLNEFFIKFEGSNPTGSFKDRGMSVAVSFANYLGVKVVACASTGNTSSSMSAYARRARIEPVIVVPKNKVAKGKLSQSILYGATTIAIEGNFDNALEVVLRASSLGLIYPLNSINPWRIEGQKTVAFEIVDELNKVPDWIALPVGNAGNISAIWKGLLELKEFGLVKKLPKLLAVQASGAAPLVNAFRKGLEVPEPINEPETIATAIRIGNPASGQRALKAVRESKGCFISVKDEEIIRAQKLLARYEGIGVEPASAAAVAGILNVLEDIVRKDESVVAIATGHALKDPDVNSSHEYSLLNALNIDEAVGLLRKLTT